MSEIKQIQFFQSTYHPFIWYIQRRAIDCGEPLYVTEHCAQSVK